LLVHRTRGQSALTRLYALVEVGHRQAIDVYLHEEDAERELEECLSDEPQWRGLLRGPAFFAAWWRGRPA
jgi:hypothetical protein